MPLALSPQEISHIQQRFADSPAVGSEDLKALVLQALAQMRDHIEGLTMAYGASEAMVRDQSLRLAEED